VASGIRSVGPHDAGRIPNGGDLAALPDADIVAAVSVHPPVLARLRERYPGLRAIGEEIPLPLVVSYDPPSDCGPDRVVGAFGALWLEPDADGVLLLDVGTCLTATVAARDRGVLGGAIFPGSALMARALCEHTAKLPPIEPAQPDAAIGASTEQSIRSGIHHALVGGVRELIRAMKAECAVPLRVVAAGTGAASLAEHVTEIDAVHAHATLVGVARCSAG